MQIAYLVSVWLHILAAMAWVGSMTFLVAVALPWLRTRGDELVVDFLSETGSKFRALGWICFGTLFLTGSVNLWVRGVRFSDFVDAAWYRTPIGVVMSWKLGLVSLVIGLSAYHDFVLGPRVLEAVRRGDPGALALRHRAAWMGRVNGILALLTVAAAVMIVRGRPG